MVALKGRFQTMRLLITTAVLAATTALAVGAGSASAAQSCGRTVINDWYVDGTIDGRYSADCYRQALSRVPEQQKIYSDLPEELTRGLRAAVAREAPHGVKNARKTIRQPAGHKSSGPIQRVLGELGPSRADSIPVPLIILAGVALVLIAAGAASAIHRRLGGRRSSS
jgi:hypothetical protein